VSIETVELFYGLLALVAFAVVIGVVVLRLVAVVSASAADAWEATVRALAPSAIPMAWVVALLATAGSLYFSELAHFEPCRLCWFQRIAMYPLVVILGIAAVRRDRSGAVYGLALALIGAVVAAYHVTLEWFPSLDGGTCDPANPCTLLWFRVFGFISLPTLALSAFLLIASLLAIRLAARDEPLEEVS
jgi:disulfide bond formation protein DsbB